MLITRASCGVHVGARPTFARCYGGEGGGGVCHLEQTSDITRQGFKHLSTRNNPQIRPFCFFGDAGCVPGMKKPRGDGVRIAAGPIRRRLVCARLRAVVLDQGVAAAGAGHLLNDEAGESPQAAQEELGGLVVGGAVGGRGAFTHRVVDGGALPAGRGA
jgi:hypothetical protein